MTSAWWAILGCVAILLLAHWTLTDEDWARVRAWAKPFSVDPRGARRPPGTSRREEECRAYLERRFGRAFPKARPAFLRNPATGSNLELDGYCPSLRLAFEYNGRQHYEETPHFHRNRADFLRGRERDAVKSERCRELGIRLLVVPHWVPSVEEELRRQLASLGLSPGEASRTP